MIDSVSGTNTIRRTATAVVVTLLNLAVGAKASPPASATGPVKIYGPGAVMRQFAQMAPRFQWLANGRLQMSLREHGKPVTQVIDPSTGAIISPAKSRSGGGNSNNAKPRVVAPGLFSYSRPIREVASPDGKLLAGTVSGNLYVRHAVSKHDVRLTHDATIVNGYTVLGARWSPNERYLAVRRMDARGVPTIPDVDWLSTSQPVINRLYSRVGDPIVRQTLVIVDRHSDKLTDIKLDRAFVYLHPVSWSPDSRYLYLMAMTRLMHRLDLIRVDVATGNTRVLLAEHSVTNIGSAESYLFDRGYAPDLTRLHYVTMLPDGGFVWTSARDGWRRLYLYSKEGALVKALTPPKLPVLHVVAYDAARGIIYYTGQAKVGRPYHDALFSIALRTGKIQKIVDGPDIPMVVFSDDYRYLYAFHGGLRKAFTVDLCDRDGRHIRQLWSAQVISKQFAQGGIEPFVVKAADGKTPIYGLLFKPVDFNPRHSYPVVETIYGGPQSINVAHSRGAPFYWVGQALASEGFVAIEIDGRGTPERGRDFNNAFYGRIGQGVITDHVAALREVAASRTWMDIHRVGVIGHSWGGYYAARALLKAPDLYKVAVASAGPASLRDFRVSIEPYMGCLPKQCPSAYDKGSNAALASQLKGKLMIMQGTADRDVPFGESMRLIEALEKANKPYQYVVFPGQPHTIYEQPYWWQRAMSYLKSNLGAARPIGKQAVGR